LPGFNSLIYFLTESSVEAGLL